MKRIWHHYKKWEEVGAGMWTSKNAQPLELMRDAEAWGAFMRRVIAEWPYSCEHNLTDRGQNRIAWIGQAATALAMGCPESVTREAWGRLTQEQQDDADSEAAAAIAAWELGHEG